jgi:carbamoyl-phosphate synthase small subunit
MKHRNTIGKAAQLVLHDGSIFSGFSFGAPVSTSGEVVFNTSMMGYPESMTDPSYRGQILVLTYPLIGNYGVPARTIVKGMREYFESEGIHIKALVISDLSKEYHHWNAQNSLDEWMREEGIPGIYGVDTRALTKQLREKGTMLGKLVVGSAKEKEISWYDPNTDDLVLQVSVTEPVIYGKANGKTPKILMIDCGCKNNIIRSFLSRGAQVIRVPHTYDFTNKAYDGLFISNGPGDPEMCQTTISNIRKAMEKGKPIFGICLGNQLLGLAAGARTYKLPFGHRSQNQPCTEVGTKRCYITSQNHGFAVDGKTLPAGWREWFVNANDGSNEGIKHVSKPFFSVQFHPEAAPGPVDTAFLFDYFLDVVKKYKSSSRKKKTRK